MSGKCFHKRFPRTVQAESMGGIFFCLEQMGDGLRNLIVLWKAL